MRFYEWEKRGRGWQLFDFQVELEPEYFPFFHPSGEPHFIDDAKRHTLASWLLSSFSSKKSETREADIFEHIPPIQAYECTEDEPLYAFNISMPKGEKVQVKDMVPLLVMLSYTRHLVSLEIVGTSNAITISLICRQSDAEQIYSQVQAYMPTAIITPSDDAIYLFDDTLPACVADFGLSEEFMRPILTADAVPRDPYIGLCAVLEHLHGSERGIVQILFRGTANPWAESIMRSVTDNHGKAFFEDAPEMVKLAEQKISSPLFAVCIRIAGQSANEQRMFEIAEKLCTTLCTATRSPHNELYPFPHTGYAYNDRIIDMCQRRSHRLGMLLNAAELATMAHMPTPDITSQKLVRNTAKTKAAPESTRGHKLILGVNSHHGNDTVVTVPSSLRLRHTHIIGATGTGKSTLLLSMIVQDIVQDSGFAVLDPHGDLIETILTYIPSYRIPNVIIIDPADTEYPVGFNILSAHSDIEKEILSSDLVAAFKRLSTSWGDQMNSVLANAILAFLESTEGGTLVDLRRFLVEKQFRDMYLKTVSDPHILYYWQHEYPLLKSSSIGSILTRLDAFLRPKAIRNMVAQKKGLDFEQILDTKKILLIKLSQGLIGAENSFLLGTFFVSKIYQAAMARQATTKANRTDFFLYIDEFQNFITPSMSHILSGARKYHLGLILAHQDMQQLQKYDSELASSVVVNAGTRICFRLGDTDAKRFASGFSYFEAQDLENLRVGEAIVRIEQPSHDFNLSALALPEMPEEDAKEKSDAAISASRQTYGTPREQVEQTAISTQPLAEEKTVEEVQKNIQPIPEPQPAEEAAPFIPTVIPKPEKPLKRKETQHRYLQMLIKRTAEARGYKAIIEQVTPDGNGRVDVSLERDGKRIAVEISSTTGSEWEGHNIVKCLAAGYEEVIVCSNDSKNLLKIRERITATIAEQLRKKIYCLSADEAVKFFDAKIAQEQPKEKVVKGYRVKVEYGTYSDSNINDGQGGYAKTDDKKKPKNR